MKRIFSLAVFVALTAVALTSLAVPPVFGPVKVKFTTIHQDIFDQTSSSTNKSSSSTNITVTSVFSSTNGTIENNQLLAMLENSFNTNFPSGSILKIDSGGDFAVVNGSSIVQDVSSVLSLSTTNGAITVGKMMSKATLDKNGESVTVNNNFSQSTLSYFKYDDSALSPTDGNTTRLVAGGIETARVAVAESTKSEKTSVVFTFIGVGGGSSSNAVSETKFLLQGGLTGTVSAISAP